jgi:hypothetical protein
MHYAFHHTKLPAYLKDMKVCLMSLSSRYRSQPSQVYHMAHHFRDYENGFGVTSTCRLRRPPRKSDERGTGKFWDVLFGTELDLKRAQRVA